MSRGPTRSPDTASSLGQPRPRRWLLLALLIPVAAGLAGVASASTLGGLTSAGVHAQQLASGAISESFTAPAGTSLSGRASPTGGTWSVVGGNLQITSSGTVQATTSGVVYATVPFAECNTFIGVDIRSSGNSTFGLIINADIDGAPATALLYTNSGAGTLRLERVAPNGVRTLLASHNQAGSGGTLPRFLSISYYEGLYTAKLNNTTFITHRVPDAERPTYEAQCNVGVMVDNDIKSTFDNFQAYAL